MTVQNVPDATSTTPVATIAPETFTVGERTYELLSIHGGKSKIIGWTIPNKGQALKANMSMEDGEYIYKHRDEIPAKFRNFSILVFPEWRDAENSQNIIYLYWSNGTWRKLSKWIGGEWISACRLVRRVPPAC